MTAVPSSNLYDHPEYYEIAFSFRDIGREVDVFEECFRRHSKVRVRRVLDIGCGPCPHMEELLRRGYEFVGLDLSKAMLDYSRRKAEACKGRAAFLKADMRKFSLRKPVDFAFTMLGSLSARTTEDVLSHLSSVAKALNPGGLYFLDWCINFQWGDKNGGDDRWTMKRGGVKVNVQFLSEDVIDRAAQVRKYTIKAGVDDHGKRLRLETVEINRVIFPQEFLLLVEKCGKFEFIGWWNNWNLDEPVKKAKRINRPITLLRRL